MTNHKSLSPWQKKLAKVIYGTDTPAGKLFDLVLLIVILTSVIFVMLESVTSLSPGFHKFLYKAEWVITGLFTLEYLARIVCVSPPKRYIFSFYGVIDFISTIPLYLTFFVIGSPALMTVRAIRLLRIFRILKVNRYIGEGDRLRQALKNSRAKIFVFLFTVVIICIIAGTLMYLIEGQKNEAFSSIPQSLYWCIVTLTTVGFGDIYPVTPLGQGIAALIMIMGYGIIAVPTGIVTAEFSKSKTIRKEKKATPARCAFQEYCKHCGKKQVDPAGNFCSNCGKSLT